MCWRTPSGSRATSMPATKARPALGRNRPQRMRMIVDLPAPLGPRKPMISPRGDAKLTWSTATKSPNRLTRSIGNDLWACRAADPVRQCSCRFLGLEQGHEYVFDAGRANRDVRKRYAGAISAARNCGMRSSASSTTAWTPSPTRMTWLTPRASSIAARTARPSVDEMASSAPGMRSLSAAGVSQ